MRRPATDPQGSRPNAHVCEAARIEEAHESQSGVRNSGTHSAAGANFAARLTARLANDPTLAAQLKGLLPTGMSPGTAATGSRNLSQFLTALNAAKDLGLDFGQLQKDMTGPGHDSLAHQAILDRKTLDPTALKTAIMRARNGTKTDLKADRAALEAAEEANEAAKTSTTGGTSGSTAAGSQTRP